MNYQTLVSVLSASAFGFGSLLTSIAPINFNIGLKLALERIEKTLGGLLRSFVTCINAKALYQY